MTLLVGSIFHMTRKIVSEMTYNVSMGTLNPTIPYHTKKVGPKMMARTTSITMQNLVEIARHVRRRERMKCDVFTFLFLFFENNARRSSTALVHS